MVPLFSVTRALPVFAVSSGSPATRGRQESARLGDAEEGSSAAPPKP